MKTFCQTLFDYRNSTLGRYFALFIQGLIVLSVISFSLETLPNLSDTARQWLYITEVTTVIIFTIEYLLRIYASEKKLKFMFSFFGIIDLLAILPFYLALGLDLRSIRAFRLLRLLRIFKLIRYSSAMQRYQRAFFLAKEELVLFFIVSMIILYLSAVGMYYFENTAQPEAFASVFHSLWWAIATLTTVGYGDVYPITAGGKILTFFILMLGLGIVTVPAGLLAAALSQARREEVKKVEREYVE